MQKKEKFPLSLSKFIIAQSFVAICMLLLTSPVSSHIEEEENSSSVSPRSGEHNKSGESADCNAIKGNYPIIISGHTRTLVPLTYLDYLEGYPAFIFIEPQNSEIIRTILRNITDSDRCQHKSAILLVNKGFHDFAIELAVDDGKSNRITFMDKITNLVINTLNREVKVSFNVENDDIYSFFTKEPELKGYAMQVDGNVLVAEGRYSYNLWKYFGAMKLSSGQHFISITGDRACADKNCLKKLRRLLRKNIIAVPQSRIEGYIHMLRSNDTRYLFYVDKENMQKPVRTKNNLDDVNPFIMGRQQFYAPAEGNYSIKALMKPRGVFVEEYSARYSASNGGLPSLEAVSGWDIKATNVSYEQNISEEGMRIDAYFSRERGLNEEIVLSKKVFNVSIKERPYLLLAYDVEEKNIQEVEIDIELIDTNSWFFKTKKITINPDDKHSVVNLYEKARDVFGHDAAGYLLVDTVALKFKKRSGKNPSGDAHKAAYPFFFKNIAFLRERTIIAEFDDRLSKYTPDIYYYFNKDGNLKQADFIEEIPSDIAYIYKLHINNFVDLKENPVLALQFLKRIREMRGDRISEFVREVFPKKFRVAMELDLDGDAKEDGSIETFITPVSPTENSLVFLYVNAYEEAQKKFPGKKIYHLLSIRISSSEAAEVSYQLVKERRLIRYKKNRYGQAALNAGAIILEVDGRVYAGSSDIERIRSSDESLIVFNKIYLKEGLHTLDVIRKDKSQVALMEIRQINNQNEIVKPPKIEFKKINPTRYVVDVKGAKWPFTLVFSESFHEGWKAYVRQEAKGDGQKGEPWSALWSTWEDRGKRNELKDHFEVNGYANGWIVVPKGQFKVQSSKFKVEEKEENWEDFEIVLEYKPQRLFEIGLLISSTILLMCILYMVYEYLKRDRNEEA